MEPIGALPDGEWEPFSRMFNGEEVQFMPQFLGQFSFPAEDDEGLNSLSLSSIFPTPDEANMSVNDPVFYSLNALTSNFHSVSQASSYSSICSDGIFVPNPSHEPSCFSGHNQIPVTNDISMCMDNSMGIAGVDEQNTSNSFVSVFPDIIMEETAYPNEDSSNDRLGSMVDCRFTANSVPAKELQLKRKFNVAELCARGGNDINPSESVMKKLRVLNAEKTNKRNAQLKKNQKITPNGNNEDSNAASEGQSCSSYSSEDDNASQETNGAASFRSKTPAAVNMNGKTRASRGTATDPQSLYARKRRERINERLRILQNLVPNGTKVDISTMLEEAVHYVKFLQLQIKLLSSDDLWMYAPLAYNGLDLGLHHKISPLL